METGNRHRVPVARPTCHFLDCGSAIGIANHANFWDTIRASNVHVHRSNISAISEGGDDAVVHLSNGERMHSVDLVVHATGWKPAVPVHFEPTSLGVSFGLPCQSPSSNKRSHDGTDTRYWHELDVATESRLRKIHKKIITPSMSVPSGDFSPYRLFRRMVSPALAAEGDRSFAVMGIVLSSTVAVVAEVQALWVAAFLTGALDGDVPVKSKPGRHSPLRMNILSRKYLDQDISDDVVWGNITRGDLNIDAIHVSPMLISP